MHDSFSLTLQRLLPKQCLTRAAGFLAQARAGWLTRLLIRLFVRRYGVDMREAAASEIGAYATFNDFFTRALRAGARPLASDAALLCPVDGLLSQCGAVEQGRILQAKGHDYSVGELLGGDEKRAAAFEGGQFATLYLSPRDYHRIHMPCAGTLAEMLHVPGALYSVNAATTRARAGLFARNERVICYFSTPFGSMAMVLVGATIVGSIATCWHGTVNARRDGKLHRWHYPLAADAPAPQLAQGEQMGHFALGSTVILLLPPQAPLLAAHWQAGRTARMGEALSAPATNT